MINQEIRKKCKRAKYEWFNEGCTETGTQQKHEERKKQYQVRREVSKKESLIKERENMLQILKEYKKMAFQGNWGAEKT